MLIFWEAWIHFGRGVILTWDHELYSPQSRTLLSSFPPTAVECIGGKSRTSSMQMNTCKLRSTFDQSLNWASETRIWSGCQRLHFFLTCISRQCQTRHTFVGSLLNSWKVLLIPIQHRLSEVRYMNLWIYLTRDDTKCKNYDVLRDAGSSSGNL